MTVAWVDKLEYVGTQQCDYCHETDECAGLWNTSFGGSGPDACICESCTEKMGL